MDQSSFRDMLVFSIGFAISRSRDLLRRLLRTHASDDVQRELAQRVVKHLEQSGFELNEERQALTKEAGSGTAQHAALG